MAPSARCHPLSPAANDGRCCHSPHVMPHYADVCQPRHLSLFRKTPDTLANRSRMYRKFLVLKIFLPETYGDYSEQEANARVYASDRYRKCPELKIPLAETYTEIIANHSQTSGYSYHVCWIGTTNFLHEKSFFRRLTEQEANVRVFVPRLLGRFRNFL